jgi:hypothetical protein
MPELVRSRDVIILFKGDTYPVTLSSDMVSRGWTGGQGVQWVEPTGEDMIVTFSDGYYAGFMLWGSDESSDRYTAITRQQTAYRYGTIGAGGWLICTTTFEKYTWASRQGPGPFVPIVYHASDRLVFSLNGLLTSEDEWTLSGDPRAPNGYYIAFVSQPPSVLTQGYMTVQVSI